MTETAPVNPVTGLPDGYNAFHRIPIINHRSIGRLRLSRQTFAENHVPIGSGRRLCFISRLMRSESLIVTFHGANVPRRGVFYPRYERVRTFMRSNSSFMCFADPTIERTPDVLLSWYLGDSTFDPMDSIDIAIDRALAKTGARDVVFVGGSGGGYAALRACHRRPGSKAFVESPRVDLAAAIPRTLQLYLDTFWQSASLESIREKHPMRFDLLAAFKAGLSGQQLYVLQGLYDGHFLWNDYRPLKTVFGISEPTGTSIDGNAVFALFESVERVHRPPAAELFRRHWQQAMHQFGMKVHLKPGPGGAR